MELLIIIGPADLDKAIEAALDVEISQKIKARKRDQAYMIDTIKEFWWEIHSLQKS